MEFLEVIADSVALLGMLVIKLWQSGFQNFLIALITGVLLAGLAWWLSIQLALGFNRQFTYRTQYKIYCGAAAVITLIFTILFFSFRYVDDVAEYTVSAWGQAIKVDTEWSTKTFRTAYESVYALRKRSGDQLEDFSTSPHPDTGNTIIPITHDRSIEQLAKTYAQAAEEHFRTHHNMLSLILWASSSDAQTSIFGDIKNEFTVKNTKTYPLNTAIKLAKNRIQQRLKEQLPRIVFYSRIALAFLFIFIQIITLALLVRAALADIKIKEYKSL